MGEWGLLPYGTLVVTLTTFAIWMYVKQLEVVNKPPGPNMWLVVVAVLFMLSVGFVAPLVVGNADAGTQTIFIILSFVGIGLGGIAMLMGIARMMSAGKKS